MFLICLLHSSDDFSSISRSNSFSSSYGVLAIGRISNSSERTVIAVRDGMNLLSKETEMLAVGVENMFKDIVPKAETLIQHLNKDKGLQTNLESISKLGEEFTKVTKSIDETDWDKHIEKINDIIKRASNLSSICVHGTDWSQASNSMTELLNRIRKSVKDVKDCIKNLDKISKDISVKVAETKGVMDVLSANLTNLHKSELEPKIAMAKREIEHTTNKLNVVFGTALAAAQEVINIQQDTQDHINEANRLAAHNAESMVEMQRRLDEAELKKSLAEKDQQELVKQTKESRMRGKVECKLQDICERLNIVYNEGAEDISVLFDILCKIEKKLQPSQIVVGEVAKNA